MRRDISFSKFIELCAQIASDFIVPKVLFCDIERPDGNAFIELFCSQNNRRLPEKTSCKNGVE